MSGHGTSPEALLFAFILAGVILAIAGLVQLSMWLAT